LTLGRLPVGFKLLHELGLYARAPAGPPSLLSL
jgi:hypothetical protein